MTRPSPVVLALAIVSAGVLAGCVGSAECEAGQGASGQEASCTGSGGAPFTYATQGAGRSKSETFDWENPGKKAFVSFAGQASDGSVTVTVLDAEGARVFGQSFSGTSQRATNKATSEGAPGEWTIRVAFSSFTGQMSLTVSSA